MARRYTDAQLQRWSALLAPGWLAAVQAAGQRGADGWLVPWRLDTALRVVYASAGAAPDPTVAAAGGAARPAADRGGHQAVAEDERLLRIALCDACPQQVLREYDRRACRLLGAGRPCLWQRAVSDALARCPLGRWAAAETTPEPPRAPAP